MLVLRNLGTPTAPEFSPVTNDWVIVDDAAQPVAGAANVISFSRYLASVDEWNLAEGRWSVLIQPADDLLEVPAAVLALPELLIEFPAFTDGRGYSHATTLRQHHGFAGDLLAVGDVRRDQLDFMHSTGFTAFEITGNDSVEAMRASLIELAMPDHRLYSGAAL